MSLCLLQTKRKPELDSEKIPLLECGQEYIEVGDVIWSQSFEWQVQSFQDNGTFSTLHRNTGDTGPFTIYMNNWRGEEFMHERYFLIKKDKPLLAYNPNQGGDTDDDI